MKLCLTRIKIISFIDNMLFNPTDGSGTKCHPYVTIEFIQTQFIKHCRPINDFFNLTCLQINLLNQLT